MRAKARLACAEKEGGATGTRRVRAKKAGPDHSLSIAAHRGLRDSEEREQARQDPGLQCGSAFSSQLNRPDAAPSRPIRLLSTAMRMDGKSHARTI